MGEDSLRRPLLDQAPQVEKGDLLRHARRLLRRVGDDDAGVVPAQFVDQLRDDRGGDGIQRRARLVHEDHLRSHGDGARDAEPLLLAAGQAGRGRMEAVLDLLEKAGALEGGHHDLLQLALVARKAVDLRPIGHVLEDRLGKGVGLLEDHPDPRAQLHDVETGVIEVLPIQSDLANHPRAFDRVVHAVEAAQESGLATAGRPDQRAYRTLGNVDRDAVDRQLVAVEDADVSRGKARRPCLRVEGPHGLVARHLQRGGHRLRRGGEGSPEEADHERRSSFCRRRTAMAFMVIVVLLAVPIGVASAIYLEEFAPKNRLTDLIEVNINNLAAVPSIVFGLFGAAVFIKYSGLPISAPIVGGLVLTLMTLPTIIIATRSSLRAVPPSLRQAALGLGASRTQMVFHHVLPITLPGILTATIIGVAQALGETAPLLLIGMNAFVASIPATPFDQSSALPAQIYLWQGNENRNFFEARTSAAIMVLLALMITMNAVAVLLRQRLERRR